MADNDEAPVEPAEEQAPVEPVVEEQPEVKTEEPTEEVAAEEPAEQPEKPEDPPPSRRESKRIAQLLEKLRDKEEPQEQSRPEALDYQKALDADEEVVKTLETDRKNFGDNRYQEGLEQARSMLFHTRLEIDAPRIEARYPELDPSSNQFDDKLAEDINETYLGLVGYDRKTGNVETDRLRYRDYVEGYMSNLERAAERRAQTTGVNIAKQAASTGIRPGGVTSKLNLNQAPETMTDEELKAVIEQAIPPK